MYCQNDLSLLMPHLITWLRECISGLSTVLFPFSFPLHMLLFKRNLLRYGPHLNGTLSAISLNVENNLFGILLHSKFVPSLSPIFYSIICLYHYKYVDTLMLHWVIIQYIGFCLNCSDFAHWALFQLDPISFWHIPIL